MDEITGTFKKTTLEMDELVGKIKQSPTSSQYRDDEMGGFKPWFLSQGTEIYCKIDKNQGENWGKSVNDFSV